MDTNELKLLVDFKQLRYFRMVLKLLVHCKQLRYFRMVSYLTTLQAEADWGLGQWIQMS